MTNIVIGAASGMGATVARQLAPRGRLLLADRDEAALERAAADLPGDIETVRCDVAVADDVDALVARVGSLEALVVTAAVASGSLLPGRRILEVNLLGTARVLTAVEPLLGDTSAAVCFASTAAHSFPETTLLNDPLADGFFDALAEGGLPFDDGLTAYSMSKRGVLQLVRRLAPSWGARGARILALSPGTIDTPMARGELALYPIMADFVLSAPLARWAPRRRSRAS
jgi:NAD(P)-dependent dehydrogenase (short-subunit alcohol dehydrogenase family)